MTFWRIHDGKISERWAEIDFVGPDLGVAFEGKYVDRPWRRAAATIRARGGGIFATRSVLDLSDGRGENAVWAVPAGMLGWMLASEAPS